MESTRVVVSGKGSNPKTALYVGGLEDSVTDALLHAAFLPFGEIKDVSVPLDHKTGKHRGFGFVEYEERDDAAAAVDNMHNAELFGRVLKVNYAQPASRVKGGEKGWASQAVWADADTYMEEMALDAELEAADAEAARLKAAAAALGAGEGEAAAAGGGPADDDS